jgi:hypothetical protein
MLPALVGLVLSLMLLAGAYFDRLAAVGRVCTDAPVAGYSIVAGGCVADFIVRWPFLKLSAAKRCPTHRSTFRPRGGSSASTPIVGNDLGLLKNRNGENPERGVVAPECPC